MNESITGYKFDIPKHHKSIIKVIGVGGGGSNAVNHMYHQGIKDVEFVVANTDLQALNSSPVPHKLQLGAALTEGLGCGANPDVGQAAAMESKEQIREILTGTKMVFVTAGMGGGTGTGSAPVIAKIAKDMDVLTVGIVTVPFSFEGKKKGSQAASGIEAMRNSCDTVLVILNDKLREIYGNLSIGKAFAEADNVLTTAAKGIAEIITQPGHVNVDFQDVRTVMLNAGGAVMGSAETRGEDRAIRAAQEALASPLLDSHDTMGARKILLSIISGEEEELQMDELSTITEYIQEQSGDDAEVIFGHSVDTALTDRIRVTVIATGFGVAHVQEDKAQEKMTVHNLDSRQIPLFQQPVDDSVNKPQEEMQLKRVTPETSETSKPMEVPVQPVDMRDSSVNSDTEKEDMDEANEREGSVEEHTKIFSFDFDQLETEISNTSTESEFNTRDENYDQVINEEGLMELRQTKIRLEQQRKERRDQIKASRVQELSKEDFNEKWTVPAYLRRGVSMRDTPHSSEPTISRYKLNEENAVSGGNKFLHDNVD